MRPACGGAGPVSSHKEGELCDDGAKMPPLGADPATLTIVSQTLTQLTKCPEEQRTPPPHFLKTPNGTASPRGGRQKKRPGHFVQNQNIERERLRIFDVQNSEIWTNSEIGKSQEIRKLGICEVGKGNRISHFQIFAFPISEFPNLPKFEFSNFRFSTFLT